MTIELSRCLQDMYETMKSSEGVGLAAPQVGILKRIAVVETDDGRFELINPQIIKMKGKQINTEGCLSIPGKSRGYVERPEQATVDAYDREGRLVRYKVSGLTAIAFCHEIDHLDGVLYIDRIIPNYQPPKEKEEKK